MRITKFERLGDGCYQANVTMEVGGDTVHFQTAHPDNPYCWLDRRDPDRQLVHAGARVELSRRVRLDKKRQLEKEVII